MYTVLYGKIDYYITLENKEVILFKISNSTKSYVAAVSVCVWGRGECVKILTLSPSVFWHLDKKVHKKKGGKKKKDSNACKAEANSKANIWIFFKVKKIPTM